MNFVFASNVFQYLTNSGNFPAFYSNRTKVTNIHNLKCVCVINNHLVTIKFNVNIVEKYSIFSQDECLSDVIIYFTKDSSGFLAAQLKFRHSRPPNEKYRELFPRKNLLTTRCRLRITVTSDTRRVRKVKIQRS